MSIRERIGGQRWIGWLRRSARSAAAADPASAAPASAAPAFASVAEIVAHCAVLLRGGLASRAAVLRLAEDLPCADTRAIAAAVSEGRSIGGAFAAGDGEAWRVLGAAWSLAESSGAPLAEALDRIAGALREVEEIGRHRETLLAAPRMTVRLVVLLPLAALGVGVLLGFDPFPVFLTPFGAALLVFGLVLQLLGMRWARVLVAEVERDDRVAGLECELVWIVLAGGAPPERALRSAVDAVSDARAEWVRIERFCREAPLARALRTAAGAGVPASALLTATGGEERARVRAGLARKAERLGVRILMPITVCVLPAFIALGVIPVVMRLLGDALLLR